MTNEREATNTKMELFQNELQILSKKVKIMERNNKILEFLISYQVELKTIQSFFEKMVKQNSETVLSSFRLMNSKYLKLYYEVIGDDNQIMNIANNVIGKLLKSKDEIKLLNLLDLKISENKHTKCYYESYKKLLIGPNWNESSSAHINICDIL